MRLDKFLKVSRLIKRRTLAKEICSAGKVEINHRVAKAGNEVKVGDVLTLDFGQKVVLVKIQALADNVPAHKSKELYEILEERKKNLSL